QTDHSREIRTEIDEEQMRQTVHSTESHKYRDEREQAAADRSDQAGA
ncbi:hypothetical protein Tco_1481528, partial [Tanacetum coccineum]